MLYLSVRLPLVSSGCDGGEVRERSGAGVPGGCGAAKPPERSVSGSDWELRGESGPRGSGVGWGGLGKNISTVGCCCMFTSA